MCIKMTVYEITSTDIVSWFFDKEPRNNVCTCYLINLPKKMFRILCDSENSNSDMFQKCTAHFAICVIMYMYHTVQPAALMTGY